MGLALLSHPRIAGVLAALLFACTCARGAEPAGSLIARVQTAGGQPVADAVVVAVPLDPVALPQGRARAEQLDQIDKEFVPKVKAVFVGSTVAFPNKDSVRHHVYSFSPAKRFELPLYAGVPSQPVLFDKAGVVVLGCNIHDWMVGYIYVAESPWFGKTGADGRVVIADLPPRRYTVRVWHPQQDGDEEATRRTLDVAAGQALEATWTVPLKPELRVRRAPTAGHGSHY
jgi:plastocyanin